mgnify:CR=1 FL=1
MDFTKNQKRAAGILVSLLVVAGISFYGGMNYGKSSQDMRMTGRLQADQGSPRGQGGSQGMRGTGMAGAVTGEVIAKDEKSITIELPGGGSKLVFYTEETPVSKNTSASLSDVTIGEQAQVTGSTNPDGSVSAQSIRLGATAAAQ